MRRRPSVPLIRRDEGALHFDRDPPAAPGVAPALAVSSRGPFLRRFPRGHGDHVPSRARATGVSIASLSAFPRRTLKAATGGDPRADAGNHKSSDLAVKRMNRLGQGQPDRPRVLSLETLPRFPDVPPIRRADLRAFRPVAEGEVQNRPRNRRDRGVENRGPGRTCTPASNRVSVHGAMVAPKWLHQKRNLVIVDSPAKLRRLGGLLGKDSCRVLDRPHPRPPETPPEIPPSTGRELGPPGVRPEARLRRPLYVRGPRRRSVRLCNLKRS